MQVGGLISQNPLRRMDPDAWKDTEAVQNAIAMFGSADSAYSFRIWFDSGSFKMPAGAGGVWFNREEDMRVVLDSAGTSIGKSHNHGFNYHAYHFYWKDRYYALGGRGFWEGHSKLIEFVPGTGEWELQPCVNAPHAVTYELCWFDGSGDRVVAIPVEDLKKGWGEEEFPYEVASLDLNSLSWTELGVVNPVLEHYLSGRTGRVDLEEYFMVYGLHKSVIIRKSDLMVVVSDAFNLELVDWGRLGFERAVDYWIETGRAGIFTVEKATNQGQERSTLLSWNVDSVFAQGLKEAIPFVMPRTQQKDVELDYGALEWLWKPTLASVLIALAFLAGRRTTVWQSSRKSQASLQAEGERPDRPKYSEMSPLTASFLSCGKKFMDTAEINAFLGLDEDTSEESKRSRRAQAIRMVNQEYQMGFGQDLIVREKDSIDRRRTTYFIRPHSDSA